MANSSTLGDPRIQRLIDDAALMMDELASLSRKLGDLGQANGAGGNGHDVVGDLQEHFRAFSERMRGFSQESRKTVIGLDDNIRTNPYVFILCALGLGFLLGKAMRS